MTTMALDRVCSGAEVARVCVHGFHLLVDGRELYLSYDAFPWFQDASMDEIAAVTRPRPDQLYWPELDLALPLEAIEHPERYPVFTKRAPLKL